MEHPEKYQPKIIIADLDYDSYLLQLHREIVANKIAEDQDNPNPFRGNIVEDNIKIIVNDTNDLYYVLKHFEKKIDLGIYEYVIIGDPHVLGYKYDTLQSMCRDMKYHTKIIQIKDWIICLINIKDNNKLIIKDNKLAVI
jgi:hypothetical protein